MVTAPRVLAVVLAWHGAHALSTHLDRAALSRRQWIGAAGALASAPATAARAATVDASSIETTPGGVKFVVTKKGGCPGTDVLGVLGSCKPGLGSYVVIDYTGFLPSGEVFDTTEKKDASGKLVSKPLAFSLGKKQVIRGLEEVVANMLPGEEVQALVPAAMAYGDRGVCTTNDAGEEQCLIPKGTNLKYFVRLLRIAPPPP